MSKGRIEAFSDGVIAIIITIMVLELRPPEGTALADLAPLVPVFLSYALSFLFIGIYWNNHHHLLQAVRVVDGRVLWANLHLLFWLSLFPFATAEMGQNEFNALSVAIYGAVAFMGGVAYYLLSRALIHAQPDDAPLRVAVGRDGKGLLSLAIYAVAVPLALVVPALALLLYIVVAAIWFVPDTRISRTLGSGTGARA